MCDQEKANEFRSQEKVVRCVIQWLDKCLPDCDLLEQIRDLADELHDKAADFEKPSPQLIQGYTAENWQEIIDGGYLCEFSLVPFDTQGHVRIGKLELFSDFGFRQKEHSGISPWDFCRPAQIKGVMRPIFVEPVGDDAGCAFFDFKGHYIFRAIWRHRAGVGEFLLSKATKYIEL